MHEPRRRAENSRGMPSSQPRSSFDFKGTLLISQTYFLHLFVLKQLTQTHLTLRTTSYSYLPCEPRHNGVCERGPSPCSFNYEKICQITTYSAIGALSSPTIEKCTRGDQSPRRTNLCPTFGPLFRPRTSISTRCICQPLDG